jgi:hypothetical protein
VLLHEPALSWVRLVVDDFPAAYGHHRKTMDLTGQPIGGEVALIAAGYARFWRCSKPRGVEVELVATDRAEHYLGTERVIEAKTLVYYTPDVEESFEHWKDRYDVVLPPSGHPRESATGERYAQFRGEDGTLLELRVSWIPHFGSTFAT